MALDLLPRAPRQAIDAITGYLNVYRWVRPNGRSEGLLHAVAIIRARWIDDSQSSVVAFRNSAHASSSFWSQLCFTSLDTT